MYIPDILVTYVEQLRLLQQASYYDIFTTCRAEACPSDYGQLEITFLQYIV